MDFVTLQERLENSWGPDTAQNPVEGRGPASGQCAVSSMIIRDWFGGEIWTCQVGDIKHYYNVLPWGRYDSTKAQFSVVEYANSTGHRPAIPSEYLFKDTIEKYLILSERVIYGN
jgi:hypothetical protein